MLLEDDARRLNPVASLRQVTSQENKGRLIEKEGKEKKKGN